MKSTTKPGKKDLPAKSAGSIKGGGVNLNENITLVRNAKPAVKKKDLPPRKDVKGGTRYTGNDNITLVRNAKPTVQKKDVPARKDVKGGKKSV